MPTCQQSVSGHQKLRDLARESSILPCQSLVTSTSSSSSPPVSSLPACLAVRLGCWLERRARCCELESATSITSVQSEPYTARTAGRLLNREVWTAGHKLVGLHASSIIPFFRGFFLFLLSLSVCLTQKLDKSQIITHMWRHRFKSLCVTLSFILLLFLFFSVALWNGSWGCN